MLIAEHSRCQPGKPRPHGESHSCCRVHAGRRELPEREVLRIALARDVADPRAGLLSREIEAGELRVAGELGGVEVEPVLDAIGEALRFEALRQLDLLGDVFGGPAETLGLEAVEAAAVAQPLFGVEGGDLRRRPAGACRGALHLVLAAVGVGGEMPDVGDVDDVRDAQSLGEQRALQQIGEQVRPQVPDVLRRIDGGAARIDARVTGLDRLEDLLLARARVEQAQRHAAVRSLEQHDRLRGDAVAAADRTESVACSSP